MSARVSVVMSTYNGERYIREQLGTLLAQTLAPYEILVSDDGSSDRTLEIVAEMAAVTAVPVHVHVNPVRLGFADNFLSAAGRARGDYIAFSDQDDRWRPTKLATSVAALEKFDAVLCSHAVGHIDEGGDEIVSSTPSHPPYVLEPGQADPWGNFYGFTMAFRRELLDHLPFQTRGADPHSQGTPLSHDRWVFFLASTFGRMVELDDRLADYRQHSGQLYGGLRHRSFRQRVAEKLATGASQTENLADIAKHRSSLLQGSDSDAARTAAQRWSLTHVALLRSAELYGTAGLGRRVVTFATAVRRGAYLSTHHGGLGSRRLRHDAIMVITPRPGRSRPDQGSSRAS